MYADEKKWYIPRCMEHTTLFHIWLRIEVGAVGYSGEHVAVSDSVILGCPHSDAVTSRVGHGPEVAGGVDPVIDGVLSGIGCADEHSQVITEAIRVTDIDSSPASLRGMVLGVAPSEQTWAAFISASLTGNSDTPLALRVWLISQITSCHISKLSVRSMLPPPWQRQPKS